MWWRLQPSVMEAATLCGGGCNPTCPGRSPTCIEQVAALHKECDKGMFSDFKEQVYLARLQPCVMEAATLCGGGCNPIWWRLQPCWRTASCGWTARSRPLAATLCGGGCNPM